MEDLAVRLADQNALLAAAGVSLRLELRGPWIGLRGPLPCRRGGDGLVVQRISLGQPATEAGLVAALGQLQQVLADLRAGQFSWTRWARRSSRAPATACCRFSRVQSGRASPAVGMSRGSSWRGS